MKQKALRKLAFDFYCWTGRPKFSFRYKSQRQQELKTDHNKTGGMIYWPAALLKCSQGASRPASLIHRARRALIFSLSPHYWRILLEAMFKARLNAFGRHSHIYLALLSPEGTQLQHKQCSPAHETGLLPISCDTPNDVTALPAIWDHLWWLSQP